MDPYVSVTNDFIWFPSSAISAKAAIIFSKQPSSQDALHGRSAFLRCEVEDPSGVQFEWLHNGAPLIDTERRYHEGGSLTITAVDRKLDGGSFQCVARNPSTGEEEHSINASFNIKCEYQSDRWPLGGPGQTLCVVTSNQNALMTLILWERGTKHP